MIDLSWLLHTMTDTDIKGRRRSVHYRNELMQSHTKDKEKKLTQVTQGNKLKERTLSMARSNSSRA
jgi:hypothetical protein